MPTVWNAFLDDLKKYNIDTTRYSLREMLELFWNYENDFEEYKEWLQNK